MALAWYNGFSPDVRDRAQKWLVEQMKSGGLRRPNSCVACGQTQGAHDYHAEDYSEPFGAHIYRFELCYRCHMILHVRHRERAKWNEYCTLVRAGYHFKAGLRRNFFAFLEWLSGFSTAAAAVRDGAVVQGPVPQRFLLDEINDGVHDPRKRVIHGRQSHPDCRN